jgi:hypothetical protein
MGIGFSRKSSAPSRIARTLEPDLPEAENRNGGGAAFRFTLPIAEEGAAV